MQTQPSSQFDFWARTRVPRITFLIGLVLGLVMGWFFHGVISFVIRLGLVILLLIPLAIALYFWFKLRNQSQTNTSTGMTVISVDGWDVGDRYGQSGSARRRRQSYPEDGPG
jgi:hypothetical protein